MLIGGHCHVESDKTVNTLSPPTLSDEMYEYLTGKVKYTEVEVFMNELSRTYVFKGDVRHDIACSDIYTNLDVNGKMILLNRNNISTMEMEIISC